VLRAKRVLRAIARSLNPSALSRNISLTQRIGTLSAGICSPWTGACAEPKQLHFALRSSGPEEPMRFNQRSSARHPQGGRLQIGIGGRIAPERVAGFTPESVADFKSESVADFPRNPQA
jgi:hypothetical protein